MSTYERPRPNSSLVTYLWPALLFLVLLGLLVWRTWPQSSTGLDPDAEMRPVTPRGELAPAEQANIELFKKVSPSVVHITNLAVRQDQLRLEEEEIPRGTGTGFVWDKKGHVVTNFHVIHGADVARVTLSDRSSWNAQVVGSYPDKDLSVLFIKAPAERLHPILIGTSHDLQVGQIAYAIGNPFGLDQTLTTGIISALGREITSVTRRPIKEVIQTDAAINPGNWGGPLLDSAGRLIGVNVAIRAGAQGIGFAIPVDEVRRVVTELIRYGKVVRPGLGVSIASDQQARNLGLRGVLILGVQPGSTAAQAGLRPTRRDARGEIQLGDVIVAINNNPIRTTNELFDTLSGFEVGARVTVTVLRDGEEQQVAVTLKEVG